MSEVTIALAKGRLAKDTIKILERCGLDCSELKEDSRKLIYYDRKNGYRFLLVKPSDVAVYVEHGVADIGVAGKDSLMEVNAPLYEMLDLKLGWCRICVCGFPGTQARAVTTAHLRVASKYPHIAREYFEAKGETVELIKLHGSVEIAPLLGLSDVIVDIVESGRTLKENGLDVLEEICQCSARVVVNRVSLKTKGKKIQTLIEAMRAVMEEEE